MMPGSGSIVVNGHAVTTPSRPMPSRSASILARTPSRRLASASGTLPRLLLPSAASGAFVFMNWPIAIGATGLPSRSFRPSFTTIA